MPQFETYEISGMGAGYEDACQRMLWRGVAHLETVTPPVAMWESARASRKIYGVLTTESDDLKALEAAIIHDGDDVTGVMHQAVMGHLAFIHKNGLAAWREHLAPFRPEGPKIWTGDL